MSRELMNDHASVFDLAPRSASADQLVADDSGGLIGSNLAGLPDMDALRRRRIYRVRLGLIALVGDLALIVLGYGLASLAYIGEGGVGMAGRLLLGLVPIYFVFSLNNTSYSTGNLFEPVRSPVRAATSLLGAVLLMFVLFFFLKTSEEFSRVVLGLGTALAMVLLALGRFVVARVGRHHLGAAPFAFLHIHDGAEADPLKKPGAVSASALGLVPEIDDPQMFAALGKLAKGLDGVTVHCPPQRRAQWAYLLKSLDIPAEIIVPELTALHPLALRQRSGQFSLLVGGGQLSVGQRIVKRAFDVGFSALFLVLLAPLLLLVAMTIRLESRGPALFRQKRIGLGNRKFTIYKFRTMRVAVQDDNAENSTLRRDSRLTRIGGFLRRTSLDELPQLLNVFIGDMSIVGPRPHAEATLAGDTLFWHVDNSYWHRHVVKPGITGLAQVRGHRGSIFEEQQLRDRLYADLEYAANWSFLGDLAIIARTVRVLVHRNAF